MYRVCDDASRPFLRQLIPEIQLIRAFMAQLNLDITDIMDDPEEDSLNRMFQLSLQYGIHTFISVYVDAHDYVNGKGVLRVSADAYLSRKCSLLSETRQK